MKNYNKNNNQIIFVKQTGTKGFIKIFSSNKRERKDLSKYFRQTNGNEKCLYNLTSDLK